MVLEFETDDVNEQIVIVQGQVVKQILDTEEVLQLPASTSMPVVIEQVQGLRGEKGDKGDANVLSIGTVTASAPGSAAEATITGTTPAQVLNLTIPRGNTGPANSLSVAAVNTLYSGQAPTVTVSGTAPTQSLTFSIPKGAEILSGTAAPATGAGSINDWYINTTTWDMYKKTGAAVWTLQMNIRGATGPANNLTIGTVTSAASNVTPAVTVTGTSPNQSLNFTIPKGAQILQGTATPATGTGSVGDWFINTTNWDVFEKTGAAVWTNRGNIKGATGNTGATGPTGPANQLSIGTVTTGSPGSTATANITGTAPVQTLSLTIPRGDVGATGPAPNLTAGTVTTGAPGSSASATVTGTNPNYVINLTVPRGDKGEIGAQWYSGANAPTSGQYAVGDYYLVTGVSGTGDVYKKTNTTTWTLQGNIRGLPGSGNVNSVNGLLPDANGEIELLSHQIEPAGHSDFGTDLTQGHWCRIFTVTLTAQYQDFATRIAINSSSTGAAPNQSAIISTNVRQDAALGAAPVVRLESIELRDMSPNELKYTVNSTGTQSVVTFWIKTTRPYTKFDYYMIDRSTSSSLSAISFNQGDARVSTEPTGTTTSGYGTHYVFPKEQLPAIAINDTFVVNSQAEMLALTAQVGDTAVRNDISTTYVLKTEPATVLANWVPLVFNASNLTQGTIGNSVLPDRLKATSINNTDFNSLTSNGWSTVYYLDALNAPTADTGNWLVAVEAYDANSVIQTAAHLQSNSGSVSKRYRRHRNGGIWGSWYLIQDTQSQQDARYVQLTGNQTIAGGKTFSNGLTIHNANQVQSLVIKRDGAGTFRIDAPNGSAPGGAQFVVSDATETTTVNAMTMVALNGGGSLTGDVHANYRFFVAGDATFSSNVIAAFTPTIGNHLTNKTYVDAQVSTRALTAHNHDASAINAGVLAIARIPTGTTSTTVALGNHLHAGVYEPVIAAGTTAQFRRGDNTWQNISGAMVDLSSTQTIGGIKTFTSGSNMSNLSITGGAASLSLLPGTQDHAYMQFFARTATPSTRSAYIGYGGAAGTQFTIASEITSGAITLQTNGGPININGTTVSTTGVWSGNGSGLTSLNGSNISTGTVADARLSSNVFLLNTAQTVTAETTFSGNLAYTNTSSEYHYNTTDRATNYERIRKYWTGNAYLIETQSGGTGSNARDIVINSAGTELRTSQTGVYIRRNGTSISSIASIESTGLTSSAGQQSALSLAATITQTGTGGYDILKINATHSTVGTGAKNLITAQLGGVNKFAVDSDGDVIMGSATGLATASPLYISTGGTYGNNTVGTTGNLKVIVVDNGGVSKWGIGASAGIMEYQVSSSGDTHRFYVAGTERAIINSTGISGNGSQLTALNGSNISTGTVPIARIPTGTTSTTVSLGNHLHDDRYYTESEADARFDRALGALGSGDFNTLTQMGSWQVNGGATPWSGFTNAPTLAYQFGTVEVVASGTSTTQNYYPHQASNDVAFWTRTKFNANDWNPWYAVSRQGHAHSATEITSGTIADARLSTNVALLNTTETITGAWTFNTGPTVVGTSFQQFTGAGVGAPTFTTRSAGTKIVLYPGLTGSAVDYGIGIDGNTMWHSIPTASATGYFRWYGGTTNVATLTGTGQLTLAQSLFTAGNVVLGNSTSSATTTPLVVNTGGTYGTNTAGTNGNLKVILFDNGTAAQRYGMGVSGNRLEYQAGQTGAQHSFYVNTANIANVTSSGVNVTGVVQATATTNSLNLQRFEFTVASAARPTGTAYVEWVGPVEPTNAINGDTWVNTSA